MDPLSFWFLLPVGIAISAIYSSTGISGANFWAAVYIVWLGIDPQTGFWLSLFSMLFGSIGGLVAHLRHRTLVPKLSLRFLRAAAPAALAGTLAAALLPIPWLILAYGVFVLLYGATLLARRPSADRQLRPTSLWIPAAGGLLTGLISVGVGELLLPSCLKEERIDRPVQAAGTTLLVVFASSLVSALARLRPSFLATLGEQQATLASILIWVIPAVLAGSQLGPVIARRLDHRSMTTYAAGLLLLAGGLMLFYGIALS